MRPSLFALIVIFATRPASAKDERASLEGKKIAAIAIEGERTIPERVIRERLSSRIGAPLSLKAIADDSRALEATGMFEDVSVGATPEGNQVTIEVTVKERPFVRSVTVEGAGRGLREVVLGYAGAKAGERFDPRLVKQGALALERLYRDAGYAFVRVDTQARPAGDLEIDLVVRLTEGPKVIVKRIVFTGNRAVSAGDLGAAVPSKPGDAYLQDTADAGVLWLQALYYDRGHIQVQVDRPRITFSKDRREATIEYAIVEGDPYTIGKLAVTGELEETEAELLARLAVAPGERFNRKKIMDGIEAIRTLYTERGFATAEIVPLSNVDAEKRTIDLTFEIRR